MTKKTSETLTSTPTWADEPRAGHAVEAHLLRKPLTKRLELSG